ncbi:MAG: hypothetical protein E6Q97_31530 [Desulfurellales bacterium]|nr:MAG: hypothetical protein E6Q97_31530 [Desulfurellales bacterium]
MKVTIDTALRYFGKIADQQNVPVGIVVTDSGKFAIKFSLSGSILIRDSFEEAATDICGMYKKFIDTPMVEGTGEESPKGIVLHK